MDRNSWDLSLNTRGLRVKSRDETVNSRDYCRCVQGVREGACRSEVQGTAGGRGCRSGCVDAQSAWDVPGTPLELSVGAEPKNSSRFVGEVVKCEPRNLKQLTNQQLSISSMYLYFIA